MPDQTVRVTFNETANPQFTFTPPSVEMTSAGKVIFNRQGSASWTFVGARVKADTLNQFTPSVNPGGQVMQIQDAFRDSTRKAYQYTITVSQNGRQFTSPDPEIVNDPLQSGT